MQTTAGDELDSSPSRSAVDSTISSASHSSEKATVSPDTAVLEKGMTIDDAPILAPMDRGFKAWRFIASGFFIDGLVWVSSEPEPLLLCRPHVLTDMPNVA